MNDENLNKLSSEVIGAAIEVHRELGPGLLESVYQLALYKELSERGLVVQAEVPVEVIYKGQVLSENGYRLDLLVNTSIVVELKSVREVLDLHKKQLLTYLKLTGCKLGLLINFNESLLKKGITRIIN